MDNGNMRGLALTLSNVDPGTVYSSDVDNQYNTGGHILVNITAANNSALTVTVQGKAADDTYYDILTSAALGAVAATKLSVFRGATPAANVAVNDILPRHFRIKAVSSNGGAAAKVTATVTVNLVR